MLKARTLLLMLTIIGLNLPMIVIADEANKEVTNQEIQALQAVKLLHVRGLAASCAACHGTGGNSIKNDNTNNIASLAGMNATDFIAKMQGFKSGERAATVMQHHAKGLNSQEIIDLAEYFSAQTLRIAVPLVSQTLLDHHAN